VYFSADLQRIKAFLMFSLAGPMMFAVQPAWILAAVGAATAATLRLVVSWVGERPSRSAPRR
jgi:hypothetical protein